MNNTKTDKGVADLRLRAEEKLRLADSKAAGYLTPEQALQMVHELQVHQVELEMQNEELRTAQIELEASRARYFDLYDLAPVGYFTLSHEDLVLEANFTAAEILGMTRSTIIDQPITHFIFPADQDIYYKLKKQLPKKKSQQASCEIRLIKKGDGPLWVRLVQTVSHDSQNNVVYRVVITDITDRIELSQELEAQNVKLEAIFENVLEGIIICSLDGVLQKWNPAALSMHGFANEREGQQDISHFFSLFELSDPSGQILAPDQWPVPRILRGEKLSALELNVRRIDQNTVRIFSYHGSIIRNPA